VGQPFNRVGFQIFFTFLRALLPWTVTTPAESSVTMILDSVVREQRSGARG